MNPLKIINYIRENKITKYQFCKKCNITLSTLDAIIYYNKIVSYEILERIANAMGTGVYLLCMYD